MMVRIGKPAPEVEGDAWVCGSPKPRPVNLSEYRGKWVVVFFYPRDFTFICPTEIASFSALQREFEREDAVIIGVSTDSFYSHKAWFESHPQLREVKYPVLADTSHKVSHDFGVLLEGGAAIRGTFIIDPEGIVRHVTLNELDVGRNVDETLRVLRALRTGELCPAGWQPGQTTLTTYDEWLAKALPRLSRKVLAQATERLQRVKYAVGDMVFNQGDSPDNFYIVVSGEAEVFRRLPGGIEKTLTTLEPGDYFGEIGLLTEARRTAAVRAKSDLELLVLDWDGFREVVESSEETGGDFAEIVRQRQARDYFVSRER